MKIEDGFVSKMTKHEKYPKIANYILTPFINNKNIGILAFNDSLYLYLFFCKLKLISEKSLISQKKSGTFASIYDT